MELHPNDKKGLAKVRKMRSRFEQKGWNSNFTGKHDRRWMWLALELKGRGIHQH